MFRVKVTEDSDMERSRWIVETSYATRVHLAHSLRRHYPVQVHGVDGINRPLSRDTPAPPVPSGKHRRNANLGLTLS